MGSIAQEVGHDLIINYFVNEVLTPSPERVLFYIVHPAMGPLRDIFLFDSKEKEFVSMWHRFPSEYITEYNLRFKFPNNIVNKIKEESKYWQKSWYENLFKVLKCDPKILIEKTCSEIDGLLKDKFSEIDKLPDFIEIDKDGKVSSIGEIKFEYLPKKALNEFLCYHYIAKRLEIPFYLVFPKRGSYTRTDYGWIKKNLPSDIEFYLFEEMSEEKGIEKPIVLPSLNIIFKKWSHEIPCLKQRESQAIFRR